MSTFSPHDLTDFLPDNLLIKAKKEFPWADLFGRCGEFSQVGEVGNHLRRDYQGG